MAIGDPLLTPTEYLKRIGSRGAGPDQPSLNDDLLAVTQVVTATCGQFFSKDASPVARLFKAKWSDRLDLDYEGYCPGIADSAAMTLKVDTDGDGSFSDETGWTINTDFRLLPLQAIVGPLRHPWDRIEAIGSKSFQPGRLVEVSAIWGWHEVPEVVKALTTLWLKIWRLEGPEGTGRVNELGQVVNFSIDVKRLVDRVMETCNTRRVAF